MSNEILFFIATAVNLAFVMFAWSLGKQWLSLVIVLNLLLTSIFAAKLIALFGFSVSVTGITYAAIFIGTDILTEHHGKKEGYKSIWMGFVGLIFLSVIGKFLLAFTPLETTVEISNALNTTFSTMQRITIASFIAYVIAQHFDVWFYHWIHQKTGRRYLWLRNNASTLVSQWIDSVIFFVLAFYDVVPTTQLIEIIIAGYLMKVIVAAVDTPFIYMSYWVKRKNTLTDFVG